MTWLNHSSLIVFIVHTCLLCLQYIGNYCDFLQDVAGYCNTHSTSYITEILTETTVFSCEQVYSKFLCTNTVNLTLIVLSV